MTKKFHLIAIAAGALALAACGSEEAADTGPVPSGPIEPIAAPDGADWSATVSETAEGGFLMGNPDAPVKLVEYASMTCPACKAFEETGMGPLVETYVKSGQVSLELRNYVRDPLDLTASLIARCTGPAGFFGITRQLFNEQQQWIGAVQSADQSRLQSLQGAPPTQQLPVLAEMAGLKEWAAMRGLPASRADQCLTDQSSIDRLVQMQSDAAASGVNSTPTFSINGELITVPPGQGNWDVVERRLRQEIG